MQKKYVKLILHKKISEIIAVQKIEKGGVMKPYIILIMVALFAVGFIAGYISGNMSRTQVSSKCPPELSLAYDLARINAWNASLSTVDPKNIIVYEFDRILNSLIKRFPEMTKEGTANACSASVDYLNKIGKHISLLEFMEYIDIQIDPEVKWSGFLDLIAIASMTFVLDFEEKGADFLISRARDHISSSEYMLQNYRTPFEIPTLGN